MITALWFLAGGVAYSVFSRCLGISQASVCYSELETASIKLLSILEMEYHTSNDLKYGNLEEGGIGEKEIEKLRVLDIKNGEEWREAVIIKMLEICPKHFVRFANIENWAKAVRGTKEEK